MTRNPFSRNGDGNLNVSDLDDDDLRVGWDDEIPFRLTVQGMIEPLASEADDGLGWARGIANVVVVWICLALLAALVRWGRPIMDAVWRMLP